jgi:hypothetical protein
MHNLVILKKSKIMKFKTMAVITAIVGCLLGAAFLLIGKLMLLRWGIEATGDLLLLCRRIGILYLGISLMFFLARKAPLSVTRTAMSTGIAVALSLLALMGIYEFSAGHVKPGIFVSVLLEALIASGFIWVLLTEKKGKSKG